MLKSTCDKCGATVLGITAGLTKVNQQYLCERCLKQRQAIDHAKLHPNHIVEEGVHKCPFCKESINELAVKCKHCGEFLIDESYTPPRTVNASFVAGILALLLGPIGLWYKRRWIAGIAWLLVAILTVSLTNDPALLLIMLWFGIVIHATIAKWGK